jgi:hypothetical protein
MDPRQAYNKPGANYQQADNYQAQQMQQKTNNTPQPMPKREIQVSQATKEKAEQAKAYIESTNDLTFALNLKENTPSLSKKRRKSVKTGNCYKRKWMT